MSNERGGHVLMPIEAEGTVESLKHYTLKDIGGPQYVNKIFICEIVVL